MGLRTYVLRRIVYTFILIIFVITLNFIIFLALGDPTQHFINPTGRLTPEEMQRQLEAVRRTYGLGEPLHIRYVKSLVSLLTFNFGRSIMTSEPVISIMLRKLPYTIFLLGTSLVVAITIGIILGVLAAYKRGSPFDTVSVGASLFLYSVPIFWLGLIFIYYFGRVWKLVPVYHAYPTEWARHFPVPFQISSSASSASLNIQFTLTEEFPVFIEGFLSHAFLPMFTLIVFQYGGYLLLTRAVMLEALTEDYVITARAKGVPERTVLLRHALKNASLPLITNIAMSFGFIFSGAVITETLFTYQGIGKWLYDAALQMDFNVLMPAFYICALAVILANFIADLLYGIIDPRIKYE